MNYFQLLPKRCSTIPLQRCRTLELKDIVLITISKQLIDVAPINDQRNKDDNSELQLNNVAPDLERYTL